MMTGRAKSVLLPYLSLMYLMNSMNQDVVLVLAGIHAATQFIAGGPEGGVKRGLLNSR
jgi:hypothetical protein